MIVTMEINSIKVPEIYAHTPPRREKINKHMMYYLEHEKLKSNIVITQRGMLIDGYCSYIMAVVCGIEKVDCIVNTDIVKGRYGKKNRTISNRQSKRKILYDSQNGKCVVCGKQLHIDPDGDIESYLTLDHILPVHRGGSNRLINLQGLCLECNRLKGDSLEGAY